MRAKVLFINPQTGPVPRKRDNQTFLIMADDEALDDIARAATEAKDAGPAGATALITELEHRGTVTYKFVSLDQMETMLRGAGRME